MLAYVFWHWPQQTVGINQYQSDLIQFHQTLQRNKPLGFQRSVVFAIEGAFWLETGGMAYEEWYLLDDSAAMDRINYAAVNGPCEEPHNRVARNAADGVGGLYRLRLGNEHLEASRTATWFSKPAGVSYRDFDAQMTGLVAENNSALWARTMTLGPTTEFCLHSSSEVALGSEFNPKPLPLQTVWLGSREPTL
jgi:hypothetical protein